MYEKNARSIYESVKKDIHKKYYGTDKKPINPFKNCKSPFEIYHLSRRITMDINSKLNRIGVICTLEGSVLLKGEQHKILDMQSLISKLKYKRIDDNDSKDVVDIKESNKYFKRDIFLPMIELLSTISLQNMTIEGISMDVLNGKKLYGKRGVVFAFMKGLAANQREGI